MAELEKLPAVKEAAMFGSGCTSWRPTATRPMADAGGCWPSGAGHRRDREDLPSLEDVFVSLIEARDRAEQPQAGGARDEARAASGPSPARSLLHVLRDPAAWSMAIAIPMLCWCCSATP